MALPDSFRLEAATARTSGFLSTTIANGSAADGSAINNATNLDLYLTAELVYSYSTAPTANRTVEIYLLYSVDGTNYEEESAHALIGSFSPSADTATHRRVVIRGYPLMPFAFKLRVKNVDTGQTITVTVNAYTHSEKVID
jgi:hypothetical protein